MQKQKRVMSKALKVMAAGTIVFSSLGTIPFNTLATGVTATQEENEKVTIQHGVKAAYTKIINKSPWQGDLLGSVYVEKTFSENFGTSVPFPGLGNTDYSVYKTGYVVIPVSGQYIFRSAGDDRTSVMIDGVKKLATDAYNAVDDRTIGHFHGGDVVEIIQTVDQDGGVASMSLQWNMPNLVLTNPDGRRLDVPLSSTYPTREQAEQAAAEMKKHGVMTEYYDGVTSTVFKGQAIEPESFTKHYGTFEPYPGLGSDYYTVKKTGYIYISETGNYRFEGGADDIYSLAIDGKEIIKNLNYPNFAQTGNIYLEKGATIKIEQTMANNQSAGYSSLKWTTPSQSTFSDIQVTDVYESKEKALASNEGALFDEASKAVNNLFINKDPNGKITDILKQADIDAAQALVNKVVDPTEKATLQANLNKAQKQLDDKTSEAEAENKAREAVNNLFTSKDPNGNITSTMTQADVDAAQALINKVNDPTKKAELQADLDKAQKQLDDRTSQAEAEDKAREAVNSLFTNKNPNGSIKSPLTQAEIDAAQVLINKVTDPTKKAALQADLDKAQNQWNANVAVVAPTANAVTNKDKVVTGKGTPGLTAVVKIGTATYTGIVGTDGKFSVTIPVQKADTIITVAQKNATKTGPSVNVKVGNYIPATAPIVDEVGPFQQAITGKAPAGAVSVRLVVNGVPQRLVEPDANGNFSFYSRFVSDGTVSNLRLKMGDIVTVDYGSKTPANLATSVRVSLSAKPIIDTVIAESDYITGLVPTGTQVLRLSINGIPQRTVTPQENIETVTAGGIGSNGRFKIYSRFFKDETGVSRKLQAGDKITVDLGAQIPGDTGTTVTVIAK
ncbi:hypothetical protein HCA64_14145 [Listeria booriae]|uniref:PA14 domain-containing protein n=1 Tax=Listeria booriae TaxID=1552123 RepID=A0A099WLS7_9LIST|nr:toxin Cry1Ac domain D-VI-related protein [Listeria booriae]KGL45448.1 hypothetical protein EP57_00175 [Listeria booriae]MBC1907625.1 hypothetical protein [Listeria booriae]STY42618.1 PA14 domain [Listeria booriae]